MTRSLAASLALAIAALACGRTGTLEPRMAARFDAGAGDARAPAPPDASEEPRPDAALQPVDAGRPPDAGPKPGWDAGTCFEPLNWKLEPRSIDEVRLAAGTYVPPRQGSSVLLEVDVQLLSGCEEVAKVDVDLQPGNATDFVTLHAFAWVQGGGACEPVAPIVTTSAFVPGRGASNLRVVVTDGHSPGGGLRLTYGVSACGGSSCWCDPWAPPGTVQEFSACGTDCDCAAGLSCLPTPAPGGAAWSCLRPCARQTDCPRSGCVRQGSTASWTCGILDACPVPEDCPAGFECVIRDAPSFCQDLREAPTSLPCRCDAECRPGQRCIQGFRATPTCEIPCAGERDCPFDWLTCGTPGFCVPLED